MSAAPGYNSQSSHSTQQVDAWPGPSDALWDRVVLVEWSGTCTHHVCLFVFSLFGGQFWLISSYARCQDIGWYLPYCGACAVPAALLLIAVVVDDKLTISTCSTVQQCVPRLPARRNAGLYGGSADKIDSVQRMHLGLAPHGNAAPTVSPSYGHDRRLLHRHRRDGPSASLKRPSASSTVDAKLS
jgi:hypothetical protein